MRSPGRTRGRVSSSGPGCGRRVRSPTAHAGAHAPDADPSRGDPCPPAEVAATGAARRPRRHRGRAGLTALTSTAAQAAAGCRVDYKSRTSGPAASAPTSPSPTSATRCRPGTCAGRSPTARRSSSSGTARVPTSGSSVTVTNVPWNGSLGTNGNVERRVQRRRGAARNTAPTSFTLNGTTCTGTRRPDADPDGRDPDAHPHGDRDTDADADAHADADVDADADPTPPPPSRQLLRRHDNAVVPRVAGRVRHGQGAAREDRADAAGVLGRQLDRRVARPAEVAGHHRAAPSRPARPPSSSSTPSRAATAARYSGGGVSESEYAAGSTRSRQGIQGNP